MGFIISRAGYQLPDRSWFRIHAIHFSAWLGPLCMTCSWRDVDHEDMWMIPHLVIRWNDRVILNTPYFSRG
jgi:hypothetical protein